LGGAEPVTDITIENVTLCGANQELAALSYGMVLRENLEGAFSNIVASGFDAGVDLRDPFGDADDPNVTIEGSMFFDMLVHEVGYDEDDDCTDPAESPTCNDDEGIDEVEWFSEDNGNMTY
jgi:hypothetical protein